MKKLTKLLAVGAITLGTSLALIGCAPSDIVDTSGDYKKVEDSSQIAFASEEQAYQMEETVGYKFISVQEMTGEVGNGHMQITGEIDSNGNIALETSINLSGKSEEDFVTTTVTVNFNGSIYYVAEENVWYYNLNGMKYKDAELMSNVENILSGSPLDADGVSAIFSSLSSSSNIFIAESSNYKKIKIEENEETLSSTTSMEYVFSYDGEGLFKGFSLKLDSNETELSSDGEMRTSSTFQLLAGNITVEFPSDLDSYQNKTN